jgi:hypothetical protein
LQVGAYWPSLFHFFPQVLNRVEVRRIGWQLFNRQAIGVSREFEGAAGVGLLQSIRERELFCRRHIDAGGGVLVQLYAVANVYCYMAGGCRIRGHAHPLSMSRGYRQARITPGRHTTSHKGDVLIAQLLQRLPCQGRSTIEASMQNQGRGFVRNGLMNTKFQEPSREQLGLGNVPRIVFFFLTYI